VKVLVLEDDELVAELLQSILAGQYPGASVIIVDRLADAREQVKLSAFDLILVDWNLPDGSGLDLVRQVRRSGAEVPIVIVSARADRQSVINAAHQGISGYITKPFDVETVCQRLRVLVAPSSDRAVPTVEELLADYLEHGGLQLSSDVEPENVLSLMSQPDELSSMELADRWRDQPALTARLMEVANSSAFRRTGQPVETLNGAINLTGVAMALKLGLAIALDSAGHIEDPALKRLAKQHHEQALAVAEQAQFLAQRVGRSSESCYKAGLLSRIGELAVLTVLNVFLAKGGKLTESEAEDLLADWGPRYGNALKVQWKLPLGLREMIGAVHFLPSGTVREDLLLMRAAALGAGQKSTSGDEYHRLMRRIGLNTDEE